MRPAITPALSVVVSKAQALSLRIELRDQRTAYIDGRPCQAIKSKWYENYPGFKAMTIYMPRNTFADFLLYVPDEQDTDTVYVVPRGTIAHDTAWSADALEPYKEAWDLLKETTPALFERKVESLSRQLLRVIEEATKRNLPYELIPRGERKKDYRLYDNYRTYARDLYAHYRTYSQRRILIKGKRCAIYTATLLPDRDQAWDGAVFKVPKDDWAEVLLYIVDQDIYVVPREQMPRHTSLSLDSRLIYDYRNAWCVLDGVDPTSSKQMAEYRLTTAKPRNSVPQ